MPSIKLVNRGAAGLLTKAPKKGGEVGQAQAGPTFLDALFKRWPDARKAKIDPALRAKNLVVPIASLTPDPLNARRHNERNLQAVQESLAAYGQRSLITVRKCDKGLIVMKGNGTLRAAVEMGWTEIAATIQEMSDAEAAGYGVADNRTAELATWDFATLSVLEKLAAEANLPLPGWSSEEVGAMRINDFTYPTEYGKPTRNGLAGSEGDIVPDPTAYAQAVLEDEQSEWWEAWQGMPEFVQQDLSAYQQVVLNFKSAEDVAAFADLVGQPMTENTRSLWFPVARIDNYVDKRYTSES